MCISYFSVEKSQDILLCEKASYVTTYQVWSTYVKNEQNSWYDLYKNFLENHLEGYTVDPWTTQVLGAQPPCSRKVYKTFSGPSGCSLFYICDFNQPQIMQYCGICYSKMCK